MPLHGLPKVVKATAILESMWGASRPGMRSPDWFEINRHNMTGRRLYKFLGHTSLLVTNACGEYVTRADEHGKPNPELLAERLRTGPVSNLLLICGSVAQKCYRECKFVPDVFARVFMPHPAFRGWTAKAIRDTIAFFSGEAERLEGDYTLRVVKGELQIERSE